MNHVTFEEKWILYTNQWWPAQWLDWKESPKHSPKAKFHQKKRSWSLFGGLLPVWSTTAFWILGNHYIWEVCSVNQWEVLKTERSATGFGQQNGPNSSPWLCPITCCATNTSKVEQIGLWSFASFAIFAWPLTKQLPLLQASWQFLQGKCFHNQQEAENIFQEFIKSWSMDFYATGIN